MGDRGVVTGAGKLSGHHGTEIGSDGASWSLHDHVGGICRLAQPGWDEQCNASKDRLSRTHGSVDRWAEAADVAIVKRHGPGRRGGRRSSDNHRHPPRVERPGREPTSVAGAEALKI